LEKSLTRNLAVITGGTKGLGLSLCRKFSSQGFDIVTCSRNEKDLDLLKKQIETTYGIHCHAAVVDLASKESVKAWAESLLNIPATVSVLINNAAVYSPGNILTEEDGYLEELMQINVFAPYELCRIIGLEMKNNGEGHIFNISSIASLKPVPNGGAYALSKHAMTGLSHTLRQELLNTGVRVTTVYPGATFTASWDGADIDPNRLIDPDDIAEVIWTAYSLSSRTVVEDLVIRPQLGDL